MSEYKVIHRNSVSWWCVILSTALGIIIGVLSHILFLEIKNFYPENNFYCQKNNLYEEIGQNSGIFVKTDKFCFNYKGE